MHCSTCERRSEGRRRKISAGRPKQTVFNSPFSSQISALLSSPHITALTHTVCQLHTANLAPLSTFTSAVELSDVFCPAFFPRILISSTSPAPIPTASTSALPPPGLVINHVTVSTRRINSKKDSRSRERSAEASKVSEGTTTAPALLGGVTRAFVGMLAFLFKRPVR